VSKNAFQKNTRLRSFSSPPTFSFSFEGLLQEGGIMIMQMEDEIRYKVMNVSVFVQLSSNGRTGIFSMVISWKFAQGPGAQFAFFLLGHHFCLRLTLRTFFFLHGSLLEPGRDPVDD